MTHASGEATRRGRWMPAAALIVIALATLVALHPDPLPGERRYIAALQHLGEPVPTIAEAVRLTTSSEACLVVLVVPAGWLLWRRRARTLLVLVIPVVTMLVVQPLLKELVDRPRPDPTQVDVRAEPTSMSFPSGHSMSTTSVWGVGAGGAAARRRPGVAAAAATPIVLTFFSSGVQGVHWPSDAVGGTLIGALSAKATLVAARRQTRFEAWSKASHSSA